MRSLGLVEGIEGKDVKDPGSRFFVSYSSEFEPSDFAQAQYLEATPAHFTHDDDNDLQMDGQIAVATCDEEFEERYDLDLFRQYSKKNKPWYPGCLCLRGGIFITQVVKEALLSQDFVGLRFHSVQIRGFVEKERILDEIEMLGSTVIMEQAGRGYDGVPREVHWGRKVLKKSSIDSLQAFDVALSYWENATGNPFDGSLTVSQRFYQWWENKYPKTMTWKPVFLVD